MAENYPVDLSGVVANPLPGVVSDAEAKLAELEARFAALEARIKALLDKYFGPHA